MKKSGGAEASMAENQSEIWENVHASEVAEYCIREMMKSIDLSSEPATGRVMWKGDYLCPTESQDTRIPTHILQNAFQVFNITDAEALSTGMRLFRNDKGPVPVLILAKKSKKSFKADNRRRVSFAKPAVQTHKIRERKLAFPNNSPAGGALPDMHKIKSSGLIEPVLRCLRLILNQEKCSQPEPACSQPEPSWYQISLQDETADKIVEKIPQNLLVPLNDILDPTNIAGIPSILNIFEHVVKCLHISHLFTPSEIVIKLGDSELKSSDFQKAITARLRSKNSMTAMPRVLAVSIQRQCSEWNGDTLVLEAGNSRSIHYSLGAFILYEDGVYTSYVRDGRYFKVNDEEQRKQWRSVRVKIGESQFLIFVQDEASHTSEAGIDLQGHRDLSSSQHSKAKVQVRVEQLAPALLQTSSTVTATNSSAPEMRNEVKLPDLKEALSRIQVCGPIQIDQCAVINLPYDEKFNVHLDCFRSKQTEPNFCIPLHDSAQTQLFQNLITPRSLAFQARPNCNMDGEKADWVYIDELCDKLRTSTGFTHSLQSLELNTEKIHYRFTQSDETYLKYIADRGMDLIHAVQYYNTFYRKKDAYCLIKALTLPDTKGAKFSTMTTRGSRQPVPMLTIYAHLLHGMFASMHQMPEFVIRLPVSESERQEIIEKLKLIPVQR